MFLGKTTAKRLDELLSTSPEITIGKYTKLVFMSDCHRGTGTWNDNFLNNQHLFFAALSHYRNKGFTYIELGDGDELWENRRLDQIVSTHSHIFWLLTEFAKKGQFYMLFGNHDRTKKSHEYTQKHCNNCRMLRNRPNRNGAEKTVLPGFTCTEGLVLRFLESGQKILLVHGHQGDLLNDTLWKLARFLVRYLWKPLELTGFQDPTSAARNYKKKGAVERRLSNWANENRQPLVCGHTHRPVLPEPGSGLYFNDGCCVHPRCITGLEIENGAICLVKWSVRTKADQTLYVAREVLEGPYPFSSYLL